MKKIVLWALVALSTALQAELSPEAQQFQKTGTVELTKGDYAKAALIAPALLCTTGLVAVSTGFFFVFTKRPYFITKKVNFKSIAEINHYHGDRMADLALGEILLQAGLIPLVGGIVWYNVKLDNRVVAKENMFKHEINTDTFMTSCHKMKLSELAEKNRALSSQITTQSRFSNLVNMVRNGDYPELTLQEKLGITKNSFETRATEYFKKTQQ
jgi:hypothetical protein